jgi:hypothetical protein
MIATRRSNAVKRMSNLLEQAICTDDGEHAARILRQALGIESDDVVRYCFPKDWPADREHGASIIGEWLQTEARFLARRRESLWWRSSEFPAAEQFSGNERGHQLRQQKRCPGV